MTEEEWLACTDPTPMLAIYAGQSSANGSCDSWLWPFCCCRIWIWLPVTCQNLNDVSERFADGLATADEYQAAWGRADAETLAADRDPPNALTYAISNRWVFQTLQPISVCLVVFGHC